VASLPARALKKLRKIVRRKTVAFRSPLKAAIIGFGQIAPMHGQGYEESGLATLAAVNDVSPLALGQAMDGWPSVRAYKDLDSMLHEVRPDIVSVCTWPQNHAASVARLAAAGVKGILCEKPLCLTLSDLEKMAGACREHGVKLAGVHQYRFHPRFVKAAEMVEAGELGELISLHGCITSTIANNGPHLIDSITFILGNKKPLSVSCACQRTRDEWNRGYPAEQSASSTIVFDGDLECRIETGDRAQDFFSIKLTGSRGSMEVTPSRLVVNDRVVVDAPVEEHEWRRPQFRSFLEWVKGRRQSYPADTRSSAETVQLMLSLYESARLGSSVELPLTNTGDIIRQLYPGDEPRSAKTVKYPAVSPRSGANGAKLASEGGPRTVQHWFSQKPAVGLAELTGLTGVILSKNMSSTDGTVVRMFETEFAGSYGSPAAVASTSGTAAIHVAIGALNPEPCDEIITTPLTDMGTVIPILAANCIPVFADVDPTTGNISAETIKAKLTSRTRAVIVVHLFGRPAELGPIVDLLKNRDISLIEDCCQAHFAEYHGRKVGTFGDFGCFSLQQSKQITCGDGGVTLINRRDLIDRAAMFVDKGWDRQHGLRTHLFLGMNYRMTELQGAVARAQLQKLPRLIDLRRRMARELTEKLKRIPYIIPPSGLEDDTRSSWWTYPFGLDTCSSRVDIDLFQQELVAEGVRVRREYLSQPVFNYLVLKEQNTYGASGYPFSATKYTPPKIEDYPGFVDFNSGLLFMSWSHSVAKEHVARISQGIAKVVDAMSGGR